MAIHFDKGKTFNEILLTDNITSLNNQRLVIEWKKIPDFFPFFSRLNLYFPYFFQVWKTRLQISILFQEFQTVRTLGLTTIMASFQKHLIHSTKKKNSTRENLNSQLYMYCSYSHSIGQYLFKQPHNGHILQGFNVLTQF